MEEKNLPIHLGIIMDGNGRWATQRGLKRSEGHKAGASNLKKLCLYLNKIGLKYLSLYAFSTENFKREEAEVNYLMQLFITMFKTEFATLKKANIKVVFSGGREPLNDEVWQAMQKITNETKDNTGCTLNICLNYGSQTEIVDTTKKICQRYQNKEITLEDITPAYIQKNLYQDLPPLDLVIRTGGEMRLSNFMLYQASYAEFFFTNTYFPDLSETELAKILEDFTQRNRRFGGN